MFLSSRVGHLVALQVMSSNEGSLTRGSGGGGERRGDRAWPDLRLPFDCQIEPVLSVRGAGHSEMEGSFRIMRALPGGRIPSSSPTLPLVCVEKVSGDLVTLMLGHPSDLSPKNEEGGNGQVLLADALSLRLWGPLCRIPCQSSTDGMVAADLDGQGRPGGSLYTLVTMPRALLLSSTCAGHRGCETEAGMGMELRRLSLSHPVTPILCFGSSSDKGRAVGPSRAFPIPVSPNHRHHSLVLLSFLTGSRCCLLMPPHPPLSPPPRERQLLSLGENSEGPSGTAAATCGGWRDGEGDAPSELTGDCLSGLKDVSQELEIETSESTLACGLVMAGFLAQVSPCYLNMPSQSLA